jgi:Lon protease-like protein
VSAAQPCVIPLFPLGTVLFPGVVLPLHVFEPRYRTLVRRLMEPGASREFGVVAIRQGVETGVDGVRSLYEIGCTAELRQVTPLEDGRYDIVAVGVRRFRLAGVHSGREPFPCGEVEWLREEPVEAGESTVVARSVRELFGRCRQLLSAYSPENSAGNSSRPRIAAPAVLPDDPRLLSHLVAATAPFTLDDRQSLLAACSTAERLRSELRLLKQEVMMLSRLRAVPIPLAQLRVPMGMN